MSVSVTETSDAVEITKTIASTIVAVAWPTMILAVALVFRTNIARVIGRASGLQWGDFRVDFERGLESAEQKAETIEPAAAAEPAEAGPPPTSLPPDYLILEAWQRVERELARVAERSGFSFRPGRSALFFTRILGGRQILGRDTVALLDDLRQLRNVAVHKPPGAEPITLDQAMRFRELADLVLAQLRLIYPDNPGHLG